MELLSTPSGFRPKPTCSSLSTKRARLSQTADRPRVGPPPLVRSAPRERRFSPNVTRRFQKTTPTRVSSKKLDDDILLKETTHYDPKDADNTFFDQVFSVEKMMGAGSFGQVVKARCRDDGHSYAVKTLFQPYRSDTDRLERLKEVNNLERLPTHRNLVSLVKAWEEKGKLYIQTELCDKSLKELCEEEERGGDEEMVWNILVDMLLGLDVLHSRSLLHFDIKPENVFVNVHNDDITCKLGDFGQMFDMNKDKFVDGMEGDNRYLAPEVFEAGPSKAADIFSLGITIFEVATDFELPGAGESWRSLRSDNVGEFLSENISADLHRVILWMMREDPSLRPTTKELLKDDFVKVIADKRSQKPSYVKRLSFDEVILNKNIEEDASTIQAANVESPKLCDESTLCTPPTTNRRPVAISSCDKTPKSTKCRTPISRLSPLEKRSKMCSPLRTPTPKRIIPYETTTIFGGLPETPRPISRLTSTVAPPDFADSEDEVKVNGTPRRSVPNDNRRRFPRSRPCQI